MAFTREFIRNLAKENDVELPKEFIDGIVKEHTTARDAFAEEQVKVEREKKTETTPEAVKESAEYKALQQSFDNYKAEVSAKEVRSAKEKAYRSILKDANLSEKGIEKAVKYADWDSIELEENGGLKGANDHIKAIKEEWAEYVETTTTTGAKTTTPPANNGGSVKTKEEIYKMENGRYVLSASERQAELAKLYQHEKGE